MSPADEGLRERVRRAILDRDNPYLSEQISEAQADVAADAVLDILEPLLTAERERGDITGDDIDRIIEARAQRDEALERADRLAREADTAKREGMSEALTWAADWLESVGLGDEHAGYLRANARAALSAAETGTPDDAEVPFDGMARFVEAVRRRRAVAPTYPDPTDAAETGSE